MAEASSSSLTRYPEPDEDMTAWIASQGFDHFDFACSKGGSLNVCRTRYGGLKGLGIDIDADKVEAARKAGFTAIQWDLHSLPDAPMVRFTMLSHFLEHVPDPADVRAFVRKACHVSREFVLIQQPYFDADDWLAERGLKLYWSDWTGHPNHMTSQEVRSLVRDLRAEGLAITATLGFRGPITSSADRRLIPLSASKDQHHYDPAIHPPKDMTIQFDPPLYGETICVIARVDADLGDIITKFRFDVKIPID